MIDGRPRRGQRSVLYLEPKRSVATIGYSFLTLMAAAVLTGAYVSYQQAFPQRLQFLNVSQQAANITAAVAICLGLIWLALAIVNGRRWHLGRVVERLSRDPALAGYLPDAQLPQTRRAGLIPALDIDDRSPRRIPKPPQLWRVTASHNVVGEEPLSIVYLRMFENQPRTRTFIQGAWREFGYVYFLRSAKSVTPSEFRRARESQDIAGLFISSEEQFAAQLARAPAEPSGGYWHSFKNIGPQTIRVRDWHGSFPPQGFLCHGTIWKTAVELLLDRADLVVLDMSGFTPDNLGVRYELQRVIDRVPIERVILLADRRSDRNFLRAQIRHAWEQMEEGSPNSGRQPRVARLAITDTYRKIRQVQGQPGPPGQPGQTGQTTRIRVKLTAHRSQSRRLAAAAPEARLRLRPSRPPPAATSGNDAAATQPGPRAGPPSVLFLRQRRPPSSSAWELTGDRLTIGREASSDIAVSDPAVSRHHADLVYDGQSWSIIDAGSANGTSVNGAGVHQAALRPGDRIEIGDTELVVTRGR